MIGDCQSHDQIAPSSDDSYRSTIKNSEWQMGHI